MHRALIPIVAFNAAYLLAAIGWVLASGNYEFLAYIAVVLVIGGVLLLIHRRVGLPLALLWCLSSWGLLHMAGGLLVVPANWPVQGGSHALYNWVLPGGWLKFDQAVHAWGFGITTWLCWAGLKSLLAEAGRPVRPGLGAMTLCVAASTGLGALNEVIEFTVTLLVPENNVGGYVNTALDLVYNLVGAIIAALIIRLSHRRRTEPQ
ncbi:hypothetical protein [Elongatibacter sediminis]|uniref:DUF2238 domain-containing protein n=1 Tax=Elongatibacter sediminis TaxID=3119006 RepID=A0AAW9RCD3_9GAMM